MTTYAQDSNCAKFKTGTFKFNSFEFEGVRTIRRDSIQIDSFPEPINLKVISRVNWLSDCTYEFEYKEVSDTNSAHLIGTKYTIEIIEIKGDTIVCQRVDGKFKTKEEMIKIKN